MSSVSENSWSRPCLTESYAPINWSNLWYVWWTPFFSPLLISDVLWDLNNEQINFTCAQRTRSVCRCFISYHSNLWQWKKKVFPDWWLKYPSRYWLKYPAHWREMGGLSQSVGDIWFSGPSPASSSIIVTGWNRQISPTFFMDHRPVEWTDFPLIAICS